MKKILFLFICFCFTATVFAQQENKGVFIIKGKIVNEQSPDTLSAFLTCYVAITGQRGINIPVNKDGSFEQSIKIEGNQNFSIFLNDFWATFYVKPNNTLLIHYDKNNFANTFSIKGNNTEKTKELNFDYHFSKMFFQKRMDLMDKLNKETTRKDSTKASDSLKVSWVNEEFNKEYDFIAKDTSISINLRKVLQKESYFYWMKDMLIRIFLNRINEFMKYDFNIVFMTGEKRNTLLINPKAHSYKDIPQYKTLSMEDFYSNPSYRDFLFSYVETSLNDNLVSKYLMAYMSKDLNKSLGHFYIQKEYYLAMASFPYLPIRDWYITNMIYKMFKFASSKDAEKVMMEFLPVCKNQDYKDNILAIYNSSKKYVPGKPAPNFTLKDENGKNVSLSDFKGKNILLDFWGVHCGPCIADLQDAIPKVHEKYKGKNVVFINVCVEDTEDNWKEAVKKYHVQGVNLFAKGWQSNPACKAYGIEAIPHYILIDKNGNYADYNCAAYSLLWDDNILDKTLAQ